MKYRVLLSTGDREFDTKKEAFRFARNIARAVHEARGRPKRSQAEGIWIERVSPETGLLKTKG